MAKLSIWIKAGTTIPTTVVDARCGNRSGDTITQDVWMELSGSDAQLKADYEAITGVVLDIIPQSSATTTGSGSLFGPERDLS